MHADTPPSERAAVAVPRRTPAHAAAQGAHGTTRQGKAVTAELDALARHLRKGRHITSWEPRHIPGAILATIAEDLTKGLTIDEAVAGATVVLPKGMYEWADKANPTQGQNQQQTPAQQAQAKAQQLATQFARRIRAAFLAVAKAALRLIRMWLAGSLAITALALAGMISDLIGKHLTPVLNALWRDAWHLGTATAEAVLRDEDPDWEPGTTGTAGTSAAMDAWIASHGRDTLEGITTTRIPDLANMLSQGPRRGRPRSNGRGDAGCARVRSARGLIAVSEVERGKNGGMTDAYRLAGVMQKHWITMQRWCRLPDVPGEQAQGWIAFNVLFQSGDPAPLAHPRCRCHLNGRLAPAVAQKYARAVGINGQEYWPAGSYQHGTAPGMGGPMPTIHDADGIQIDIAGGVPGATAGGEPSRWNGDEAPHLVTATPRSESEGRGDVQTLGGGTVGGPYRDRSDETHVGEPLDADDADWPEHRGVPPRPGRDWPAPYMDGYWPTGGHGTGQAPGHLHRGRGPGRPPNAHGKTVKGAADLSDANPVDAEHVKALMERNFPGEALGWVKDARWIGPIEVPQDRIDTDDEESWAASHQPDAVKRFAKHIKHGTGHTQPVILVQHPGSQKALIIDGHHRTLAYRRLGRPVKAYVGMVGKITPEIRETHLHQINQGASPANKSAETPSLEATPDILGPEGLWHTPDRHVGGKQKLPNYIEHIAHALMRDQGMDESRAIATAINAVKRWAAGDLHWGKGKVSPEVQAASQRALAEWEALRQSHK